MARRVQLIIVVDDEDLRSFLSRADPIYASITDSVLGSGTLNGSVVEFNELGPEPEEPEPEPPPEPGWD